MKEIGKFLKNARLKNGVSISEASDDLNLTQSELENLEEGNIRAFKDVYALKNLVKDYSKYLGINPDKVLDEFNDFMFEHTSKISLDDIIEARKQAKEMEEKNKIASPYTVVKPVKKKLVERINTGIILQILIVIFLLALFVFLWTKFGKHSDKINNELMGRMSDYCEFSN